MTFAGIFEVTDILNPPSLMLTNNALTGFESHWRDIDRGALREYRTNCRRLTSSSDLRFGISRRIPCDFFFGRTSSAPEKRTTPAPLAAVKYPSAVPVAVTGCRPRVVR